MRTGKLPLRWAAVKLTFGVESRARSATQRVFHLEHVINTGRFFQEPRPTSR